MPYFPEVSQWRKGFASSISLPRFAALIPQTWGRTSPAATRNERPMAQVETMAVRRGFERSVNSAMQAPMNGKARMSIGASSWTVFMA